MPLTPFHFGPASTVSLPLRKYFDFPVFVLANVVVDFEPLIVMVFGLDYPLHGYFHTFLIGCFVGTVWGIIAYLLKDYFQKFMKLLRLSYDTNFTKMITSGILGIWFHILLDASIYLNIHPFFPFKTNPLYGIVTEPTMYLLCAIFFIPAAIFYIIEVVKCKSQTTSDKYSIKS